MRGDAGLRGALVSPPSPHSSPLFSQLVDLLYEFLSANRMSLGNSFDDATIASKRIDRSKKGIETCSDTAVECCIE